jgi:hypothetical protein
MDYDSLIDSDLAWLNLSWCAISKSLYSFLRHFRISCGDPGQANSICEDLYTFEEKFDFIFLFLSLTVKECLRYRLDVGFFLVIQVIPSSVTFAFY